MARNKNERSRFARWMDRQMAELGGSEIFGEGKDRVGETLSDEVENPTEIAEIAEKEIKSYKKFYSVAAVVLGLILVFVLVTTASHMPAYGTEDMPTNNEVYERYVEKGLEEAGATNIVAGVILDYRAFDTLGESHVLFTALCVVLLLLLNEKPDEETLRTIERDDSVIDLTQDLILTSAAKVLVPIIVTFGIYVVLNGHLSPGGGFSGGTIIGAGLIFYSISYDINEVSRHISFKRIKIITLISLAFYSCAKCYSFFCGANGLESGITLGKPGAIFSAGLILPLNIAVGAVVACTMYSLFAVFRRGRI